MEPWLANVPQRRPNVDWIQPTREQINNATLEHGGLLTLATDRQGAAPAESLLHALAPSLNFQAASEPDADAAPTRRLTVLLGAGASAFASAPSTSRLTEAVKERPISNPILDILQSTSMPGANYEDAFHVLEQLESLKSPVLDRASESLIPFLQPLQSVGGITLDLESVRRERFEIMETIAAAFQGVTYDTSWRTLADIFGVCLAEFNLDIFTLNYDLLADVAVEGLSRATGKKWYDGFGSRVRGTDLTFNPAEYAKWNRSWGPEYLRLQHLHGSLGYAYARGEPFVHARRFVLEEATSPEYIRENWAWAKSLALELPAETFCGIAPIISGLNKLQKLNVQPFANYYAAFAQAISASPRLLIVGYGKGDDHINHWIREFAQIHNQSARIVEITDSDDRTTFAVQRISEWPNLNWSRFQGSSDVYKSAGGVQNLVITSGLHRDANLPDRFEALVIPFLSG
jgi:hypothetical protein